jgi:hypothetical protein
MTLPEATDIYRYWQDSPPEHELLARLAAFQTGWKPASSKPMTREEHQRSLEERWRGGVMNPKQLFEATGGAITLDGAQGPKYSGGNMPGIGKFPGAP